ncbi:MAG TPA: beta-ketoacyl-[acyl-carrier-protein] synthase family protein [Chthoniobacterales bacterium]|nr:beta-ketoacyl-[acyl-carrier-protein] synthase family protein [Chthoniobacterales bacterium]
MKRNRVVVTGMGILAPNGNGLEAFWKSLLAGESGVGPITLFDASEFKSRIAGEVKNFDPLEYMPTEWKPHRMARHTKLAYAATRMALKHADLDPGDHRTTVLPICIGVSTGGFDVMEHGFRQLQSYGPARISSAIAPNCLPQAAANLIAQKLGMETHVLTISSACRSGLDAIASAASRISSGEAEIAIGGGTDAAIAPLAMATLTSAGLSSVSNADPSRASRPYDSARDSGVISEGAGIVVLENLDYAIARGAVPYLEITGYAAQTDHDPDDPCSGLEPAMRLALANASHRTQDIDYICAYGPGHPVLDVAEVRMIRRVFGTTADNIPVSSIKGVTGNPLAATGPIQLITCALAFKHNTIPPTINLESPGSDCDLDFVPARPRKARLNCALINVRGLGGGNSSMVVERVPEDTITACITTDNGVGLNAISAE